MNERDVRKQRLDALREAGVDPYPAQTGPYTPIAEVREAHDPKDGEQLESEANETAIVGRLKSHRSFGKLIFFTIVEAGASMQVSARKAEVDPDVAIAVSGGVVSIASMVGFITLFGVATRNGVLLVTHYQHLMRDEGLDLREAVVRGSRERLAPVLLTALTAGLALVPLVLAGDHPGNEIQSPMAEVILGGLISSTFLNLVVVPVLFLKFGDVES